MRYGRWPSRVRLFPDALADLRSRLFTADDFAKITAKVSLVAEEAAGMIAEDDTGASYNYGQEGFPEQTPRLRAAEWLGVRPKPE